ncbi:hypothetical protein [Nocardioides sambongensis]|uniref:hypothetical protein n=1 Tax=Nocardioides sambongensis TaxID=2589074 RepID=UPI00112A910C|nr:hypothetical protein [Nocardioides sambongensis]
MGASPVGGSPTYIDSDPEESHTRVFPPPVVVDDQDHPAGPGDPGEPAGPVAARPAEKGGLTGALAVLGAGLLGAGILIAAFRGRDEEGDIDWTVLGSGLAAVLGLLGLSLVVALAVRRTEPGGSRADLVTWPGVVGILGLGVLLPILLDEWDVDEQAYLVGAVMLLLAVLGYLLARRPAFAVTAVIALGVIYLQGFEDLFGDQIDADDVNVWLALGATAFVALVTIVGWALPSRIITGVAVGVIGVVGICASLLGMLLARMVAGLFGDAAGFAGMLLGVTGSDDAFGGTEGMESGLGGVSAVPADYESDVAVVLALAGALALLWLLAAWLTNHSGFSVLALAIVALALPLATVVLAVEHPTWWVAGLGAGGAVVLLLAMPLARRRARKLDEQVV